MPKPSAGQRQENTKRKMSYSMKLFIAGVAAFLLVGVLQEFHINSIVLGLLCIVFFVMSAVKKVKSVVRASKSKKATGKIAKK